MIVKSKEPVYRGFTYDGENIITSVKVDGYCYADRLLEGVIFNVIVTDGYLTVETTDDDKKYMDNLNEKKWLTVILDEVESLGMCTAISDDYDDVFLVRNDGTTVSKLVSDMRV